MYTESYKMSWSQPSKEYEKQVSEMQSSVCKNLGEGEEREDPVHSGKLKYFSEDSRKRAWVEEW